MLAIVLALPACQHQFIPQGKIISDNPCVDAMLPPLYVDDEIGGVSILSQSAESSSVPLEWSRTFIGIKGTAEEIIAAHPKLYLASGLVPAHTQAMLRRFGIALKSFRVPNSVAESEAQILELGQILNREKEAQAWVQDIEAAYAPRPPATTRSMRPALFYQAQGLILGEGTLADDELRRSGFSNAARNFSHQPWANISSEEALMSRPTLLLVPQEKTEGRAMQLIRQASAAPNSRIRVVHFPENLLNCGGLSLVKAHAALEARAKAQP